MQFDLAIEWSTPPVTQKYLSHCGRVHVLSHGNRGARA
jgi:hypothetical protein